MDIVKALASFVLLHPETPAAWKCDGLCSVNGVKDDCLV